MKYFIGAFLLCLIIEGCGSFAVFSVYPKGTRLSLNMLKKSDQIVKVGDELILVMNFSTERSERYDPYLLFFDKKGTLYAASYFVSEKIDTVRNDTIFAFLNESRAGRTSSYHSGMPEKYAISYTKRPHGSGRMESKIIDKVILDKDNLSVNLFVCQTANKSFSTYNGEMIERGSGVDREFVISDTLNLPLSSLIFNDKRTISTREMYPDNYLYWDNMLLGGRPVPEKFYTDLFSQLSKNFQK